MAVKERTSHKSYYILFTILGVCMGFLLSDDILPYYYDWSSGDYVIKRTLLRDEVAPGEALRLSELLPEREGNVCVVMPHTGIVIGLDTAQRALVNGYLKNIGADMDGDEWALVYVDTDKIEVNVYRRSKYLWLASALQSERAAFPTDKGFTRETCAPIDEAVLMKSYLPDQNLIEFGSIKMVSLGQ